jgi:hypothetical protein
MAKDIKQQTEQGLSEETKAFLAKEEQTFNQVQQEDADKEEQALILKQKLAESQVNAIFGARELKIGQPVVFVNHAGAREFAEILHVYESGAVDLEIQGQHENDKYTALEIFPRKDKSERRVFIVETPPTPPKKSLERHHPKGLILESK